jgi:RNA polymerase sigma-70 factor (sigma-E family)
MGDAAEFANFAAARTRPLLKTAWLLTGDWHMAEDIVQEALVRTYQAWRRSSIDNLEAYTHTVLVRTYLSLRRRRMFWERPTEVLPDTAAREEDSTLSLALAGALAELKPADRAVLVLRYLYDRSVEQVAHDLNRSPAAIRTMSRRALDRVRAILGPAQLPT